MPTYQYACNACGHELEAVQSFTDAALSECPECGSPLRKVYSAVGVVFKGSGFYKTDSRNSGKAGGKESGGKESAGKESSSGEGGKAEGNKAGGGESGGSSDTKKTEKPAASSGAPAAKSATPASTPAVKTS